MSEAALNANNLRWVGAVFLLAATTSVWALSTDSQQPVEITADFAELDDESGRTTYLGNVVVVQGSIRMTGDRLRASFDVERQLEDVFVDGKSAFFKQTPDGGKEDIEGYALEIEYHAKKDQLVLIKDARLTQGARLFEGYRINYDTKRSIITGRGAPATGGTDAAKNAAAGRIKVIIPPKPKAVP